MSVSGLYLRVPVIMMLFLVGLASLAVGFAISVAGWWEPSPNDTHKVAYPVIVGAGSSIMVMVHWGVLVGGRRRWAAFSLVGVLMLGFSVFMAHSVGIFIAPWGLALLVFSVFQLVLQTLKKAAISRLQ